MRPFFSYYGAKWSVARHLGGPRRDIVVEPFAGSAAYSTRWCARDVLLFDVSGEIVALWDWLIHSSSRDVARIPDSFDDIADVMRLPVGPQMLVRFWVAKGRAEPSLALSPWYFQYRNDRDCKVWGPAVKARIIGQKPQIERWRVEHASYDAAPDIDAHWHIDPPYSGSPGRRYPHASVDFAHLADWARARRGYVEVCENHGATWLPFTPLCNVVSSRGRRDGHRSEESVWSSDTAAQDILGGVA
jgi:hypothetical protein